MEATKKYLQFMLNLEMDIIVLFSVNSPLQCLFYLTLYTGELLG